MFTLRARWTLVSTMVIWAKQALICKLWKIPFALPCVNDTFSTVKTGFKNIFITHDISHRVPSLAPTLQRKPVSIYITGIWNKNHDAMPATCSNFVKKQPRNSSFKCLRGIHDRHCHDSALESCVKEVLLSVDWWFHYNLLLLARYIGFLFPQMMISIWKRVRSEVLPLLSVQHKLPSWQHSRGTHLAIPELFCSWLFHVQDFLGLFLNFYRGVCIIISFYYSALATLLLPTLLLGHLRTRFTSTCHHSSLTKNEWL